MRRRFAAVLVRSRRILNSLIPPGRQRSGGGRAGPQWCLFRRNLGTNVLSRVPQNGGLIYRVTLCSALFQAQRGKAKVCWEICVSVSDNYDSI